MGDDDARVQRAARGGSPPSEGGQGAPPLPGGRMRVLTTSYTLSAAAGSNGLAHGQAISGVRRSEPLPPVAPPLFHTCSIPWAQKRALWLGQRPQVEVDPFCIERGQPTTTSPVGAHGSRW